MDLGTSAIVAQTIEPIKIAMQSLNISTLIPMLLILTGAILILVVDLIKSNIDKSFYIMISILLLFMDLFSILDLNNLIQTQSIRGFFDTILIDPIAILSQLIIVIASILFIPFALSKRYFHEYSYPEFFALFLFMIAGFQFMVATDNLILIFVGLETASLALYTMIAMHNRSKAFQAAIKYFTMGALAAAFYAFGAMMLYACTGSVEISKMMQTLTTIDGTSQAFLMVGTIFLLASFGFKLSMVPFHTWIPDIYEGSTAALAGYMSIVPKIAGLAVVMRLFEFLITTNMIWLEYILFAIIVITMTAANIWALVQDDVKRMLAYSSISHTGFAMTAIYIGTTQANSALFLYWVLFMFTNLGAFAMLWVSREKNVQTSSDHPFNKFSGMIKTMPTAALIMAIFMLSLAGVPPFSLFWGKFYMISSAIASKHIILAIIMALNSAIAAYYYLKLIVYMFFKEPKNDGTIYMSNASISLKAIIAFSAFMTIIAIIYIEPLFNFINNTISSSTYHIELTSSLSS